MASWFKWVSLWLGLIPVIGLAHPHAWIDVQTYVDGEANTAYGINMVWRFDPMTSAYLLEDQEAPAQQGQTSFERIASGLIASLKTESYFTQIQFRQGKLQNLEASLERVTMDGLDLVFSFYLSFDQPLKLDEGELAIQVFDPSYFIEMAWPSATDLQLSEALSQTCQRQVLESEPSAEQVAQAWAMPIDAEPDRTLGAVFAQRSQIQCQ